MTAEYNFSFESAFQLFRNMYFMYLMFEFCGRKKLKLANHVKRRGIQLLRPINDYSKENTDRINHKYVILDDSHVTVVHD